MLLETAVYGDMGLEIVGGWEGVPIEYAQIFYLRRQYMGVGG